MHATSQRMRGRATRLLSASSEYPRLQYGAIDPAPVQDGLTQLRPETNLSLRTKALDPPSHTSVDWLRDSINESNRILELRRRKSLRGRLIRLFDQSVGWIVASLIGACTAFVAFTIARLELFLFDVKSGYCSNAWWNSRRFCCPHDDELEICGAWITWGEVLPRTLSLGLGAPLFFERVILIVAALLFGTASCWMTVHYTRSTEFEDASDTSRHHIEDEKEPGPGFSISAIPTRRSQTSYFAAGSGIPEVKVILGGFVIRGYLSTRVLIVKSIGLPLAVASGLPLGKEGPFVHIATCIGSIITDWIPKYRMNEGKRREVLSAACGAGVAVAFGAPVGGVLFSLEDVSSYFPAKVIWRSLFCTMTAAATLKFLDPFGTGNLVLFEAKYNKDWHSRELAIFLFLGLFGGLYGALFTRLNLMYRKLVRNRPGSCVARNPIWEVAIVTLLAALAGFTSPLAGLGDSEVVQNLFEECRGVERRYGLCLDRGGSPVGILKTLGLLVVSKATLSIVTFGTRVPAGIFIPTLTIGASFGRIVGTVIQHFQWHGAPMPFLDICASQSSKDCVVPGLYAMVGAAAALSGVTRSTIALAVIVFELTANLSYVIPVMLSILVAKAVADALQPNGIFECIAKAQNLPLLERKRDYLYGSQQLAELIHDVPVINADSPNTVNDLNNQLSLNPGRDGGFPIVVPHGDRQRCIGYITNVDLQRALESLKDRPSALCTFASQTRGERQTAERSEGVWSGGVL